jgi:hypothetical protein
MTPRPPAVVLSCLVPLAAHAAGALAIPAEEVRLKHVAPSLLAAPVTIGGARRWLLVDTATKRSLITKRLAEELGLRPRQRLAILSPLGEVRQAACAGPVEVRLGGVALVVDCVGWAPAGPDIAFHAGTDGILGVDALRQVEVLLDEPRERMWVAAPGRLAPWVTGDAVPIRLCEGLPAIAVEMRRRGARTPRPAILLVDSGASDPLIFGVAAEAMAAAGSRTRRYELATVAGRSTARSTTVEIAFGTGRASLASAMLIPDFRDREEDGVLPTALLGRFLLDLPASRLVLNVRWVTRTEEATGATTRP